MSGGVVFSRKRCSAGFIGKLRNMPPSALIWAWQALCLLDTATPPASAQEALEGVLSSVPESERRDRNLTAEYFYGALRQEIRVQWLLGRLLPQPEKLPLPLLRLLLIASYGLLFLERVPAYAVLSTTVDAVRRVYGQGMGRLANGVLRSLQRWGTSVQEAALYVERGEAADSPAARARFFSLPESVYLLWDHAYGRDIAERLAYRSQTRPVPAVRVHAGRSQAERLRQALLNAGGEDRKPVAVGAWGVGFPGGMPVSVGEERLADLMAAGRISSQSAGSQYIMSALWSRARLGEGPLWDACCGYGGKAALAAEQGARIGLCSDASWSRLRQFPQHFHRLHLPEPPVILADARHPPVRQWQGNILADVPCSGLGVLARRPDIRRHTDRMPHFPQAQYSIALALSRCLLPGRCLVYMTCTLHPAENEQIVQRLEATGLRCLEQVRTPHDHPFLEGMFGAVLQKTEKALPRREKAPPGKS